MRKHPSTLRARPPVLVCLAIALQVCSAVRPARSASLPVYADRGAVVAEHPLAAQAGIDVLKAGGNAVDAAVATAFVLAVVHPEAGNIGGGGFLLFRSGDGRAVAYDFREAAPAKATPRMFLQNGQYSRELHHDSHLAVGVPGTVAGLHLAWQDEGSLPWPRLLAPAIALARDGFIVSHGLADSLRDVLPQMKKYPASLAQFSKGGVPYEAGDRLIQPDLARTLERISKEGPAGFYQGEVAERIEAEMASHGGMITREDLRNYRAIKREPIRGTYRGYEILSMPPPSSGGVALIQMLNILENDDLRASGFGSARTVHRVAEAMRRAFADRARFLGDPDFNPDMPIDRLISKSYAAALRRSISPDRASRSSPESFEWPVESPETTHLSVVDSARNAVALTYTLEENYGSRIVVPGAGFLLNNEMGDFNPVPGLTTTNGLIGTTPNLVAPGKRMLSSMTPTIVTKEGKPWLVLGSPGGRTIINTILLIILNTVDFQMNAQAAVDAPRFHHQWLPDEILYERHGLSPDTIALLEKRGHVLKPISAQGVAAVISVDQSRHRLEAAADRRAPNSTALGW